MPKCQFYLITLKNNIIIPHIYIYWFQNEISGPMFETFKNATAFLHIETFQGIFSYEFAPSEM